MTNLLQLAASALAASGGAAKIRTATIRMTAAALCAVLASALLLAAVGCAAVALWIVALPSLSPVGAALAVAAVLTILTLLLAMTVWLIMRPGAPRPGVGTAPLLLQSEATRLFSEHRGALLLAAVVAGMAAAKRSRTS